MKNIINLLLPALAFSLLYLAVGCTPPEETPVWEQTYSKYQDYLLLEEVDIPNQKLVMQLYAQFEPRFGYNNLAVLLLEKETQEPIFGDVTFWPTFKTATATHTTLAEPLYDSDYPYMNHCGVVFTPQKNIVEDWRMHIYVGRRNSSTVDTLVFDWDIKTPDFPLFYEFTHRTGGTYKTYYAALCHPLTPVWGNNSVNIVIYRNEPANKIITPVNWWIEFEKSLDSSYFSTARSTASSTPGHYFTTNQHFSLPGLWKIRPIISGQSSVLSNKGYFLISAIEE